jgi:outer membrane lipopolysaccharide assembly protein LptE/RlpB
VRRRTALSSALLAAALVEAGCGYGLVGTGSSAIPKTVQSVYVSTFVNQTSRVGLEQRLTDAVIRELAARRRLRPAADLASADAELVATLLSYQVDPVRYDDAGRALEYQISVTARIVLTEKGAEKPLFAEPSFLYRQPYTIPPSARTFFDVEPAAIDELARPFARSLVTTMLEGF